MDKSGLKLSFIIDFGFILSILWFESMIWCVFGFTFAAESVGVMDMFVFEADGCVFVDVEGLIDVIGP